MKNSRNIKEKSAWLLVCLAAAVFAVPAFVSTGICANKNAGTSAAQFLKIGAGARGAGMAEAQAAVADDIYAAYYNPAGLALIGKPMMGAMHAQYLQGARYQYGAMALPVGEGNRQAWGFSIANLGVSDMERRTQDTDLPAGYFEASNFAYGLTYARRATDRLSIGITGKSVSVNIDDISGQVFAADLGLRYRPDLRVSFPVEVAVVTRNLGTKLKLGTGKDPLPSALVLGGSAKPLSDLLLALDLTRYRDTDIIISAGGEYRRKLSGRLQGSVRGGYSNHNKNVDGASGVTLGAGLSLPSFAFDFAWVPFGALGTTFRYSLLVQF